MEPQLLLGICLPFLLFLIKHEIDINKSKPEITLDTIFNHALSIRNIGKSNAHDIKEVTSYFRQIPEKLSCYSGSINYYTDKDYQIFQQVDFKDWNKLKPLKPTTVRFEYQDSGGHKFYSEIEVKRNKDISPPWFFQPKSVGSGRIWF